MNSVNHIFQCFSLKETHFLLSPMINHECSQLGSLIYDTTKRKLYTPTFQLATSERCLLVSKQSNILVTLWWADYMDLLCGWRWWTRLPCLRRPDAWASFHVNLHLSLHTHRLPLTIFSMFLHTFSWRFSQKMWDLQRTRTGWFANEDLNLQDRTPVFEPPGRADRDSGQGVSSEGRGHTCFCDLHPDTELLALSFCPCCFLTGFTCVTCQRCLWCHQLNCCQATKKKKKHSFFLLNLSTHF